MQRPPFTALAGMYDAIMADIEYDDWADFVLTFLRAEDYTPGTLLDLACGTGASGAPFARAGLQVTGLDGSADMLRVARERHPEFRLVQGDLRDFELGERFDLITCIFDSLNNLTEPGDLERALVQARNHLRPGGWLAFDVNTRLGVRELWEGDSIEGLVDLPDGREAHYHWSHHYEPDTELGVVQAFMRVEGEDFVELHRERGYDPEELEPLLGAAGFESWMMAEYPDFEPPTPDTARVWVFARVPDAPLEDRE